MFTRATVSVHADIASTVIVRSFTIASRNGVNLPKVLLTHNSDAGTPAATAAINPLKVLAVATTYDVQFMDMADDATVI